MAQSSSAPSSSAITTGATVPPLHVNHSRRYPSSSSKGILGHPEWPLSAGDTVFDDMPQPIAQPNGGASRAIDSSGIDRLVERFDRLEARLSAHDRRFDRLELQMQRPPDALFDHAQEEPLETPPPVFNHERGPTVFNHGRDGEERWRRGVFHGQGRPSRGRARPTTQHYQHRRRDNYWGDHDSEFHDDSHWVPPAHRQHQQGRGEVPRGLKLEAPYFDGTDAANWIARVQYYFDHLALSEQDRLHYVVMLFQSPASEWVFNYHNTNPYASWTEFLKDVRHRFDPQSYQNYIGPLSKLVQTGTVAEYHATFERYLNRIEGLPESALIPMFIAGLKDPIQEKVELQQPSSLSAAMALALRLAASHEARTAAGSRNRWSARPTAESHPQQNQSATVKLGREGGFKPIRVSSSERAERAKQGLCFHCPEKWGPGHVCKVKMLAYVGEEEDDVLDQSDPAEEDAELIQEDLSHLKSLAGGVRARPFRVAGSLSGSTVSVLVDSGSTHDFVHPTLAERLRLPLTQIHPFRVYVGNGASIVCSHVIRGAKLILQGAEFCLDLHVLDIHGTDIILGMAWLESLGTVSADFVAKTLSFSVNDKRITIQGTSSSPQPIIMQSLFLLNTFSTGHEIYEVFPFEAAEDAFLLTADDEFPTDLPAAIRAVLEEFRSVFSMPTGMPPSREFDHMIHLLPDSKPVNVRPYRYPYFQKNEIERQVNEMLEQGIIQRSQSSFSSPVLLIRKKDGTFRFCIDYRALNMVTVPDHFPIPTADELFDELGAAVYFSKLDLRSGYHQIRMHTADTFKTAFRTHDGHFEFLVMPFGLTNAPSTFQAAMNSIFRPLLRKCVIVFFDDILVYSPDMESHGTHLAAVLDILRSHRFFVKLPKCSFCSTRVEYLGHIITKGELQADKAKIEAMTSWPTPKSVKQLRGFLGLTGYYRRFVSNYAMIAAPLTDLLKKEAFIWSPEAAAAFDALKAAMTSASVLSLPDFSKRFIV